MKTTRQFRKAVVRDTIATARGNSHGQSHLFFIGAPTESPGIEIKFMEEKSFVPVLNRGRQPSMRSGIVRLHMKF
jgi:hypothetical protein